MFKKPNFSGRKKGKYKPSIGGYSKGAKSNSKPWERDNEEKITFRTKCSDCDRDCTVPFKPSGRKPVLCSYCFHGQDRRNSSGGINFGAKKGHFKSTQPKEGPSLKEEIQAINEKLSRILVLLGEKEAPKKKTYTPKNSGDTLTFQ